MKGLIVPVESYSAFGGDGEDTGMTKLCQDLDIQRVFVVGLAYDFCVGSTACDAAKCGYETYIIEDCTKPVIFNDSLPKMLARLKKNKVKII